MNLETIYQEYKNMVFNLALHYVQNKEDAQEITQDVFVAIHHSLGEFKGNSKISTWIYRITIHKSLDFIKSKQSKKRFAFLTSIFKNDSNEILHDKPSFNHPGVLMEQKESIERIFLAINQLPENQKTAIILSKIENKSQNEIAEIMNLSSKAIESLISRGKENLSKKLLRHSKD